MDLATIAASIAALISAIAFFKNMRDKRFEEINKKMDIGFQKIDECFKEVHQEFKEVHEEFKIIHQDISEVKERLSFVEAAICFVDIIPDPNLRSDAARKAWIKRRGKQLTKKE